MDKLIENLNLVNVERAIVEKGHDHLTIRNCTINGTRIGLDIQSCKTVDIENCKVQGEGTWGEWQYAYIMRLGFSGLPLSNNGLVRINKCNLGQIGKPSSDYSKFNRDIIANEGGELWIKDSTLDSASDACVDGKGTFKLKNCTLKNSHRLMRVWSGNTVIISGCTFTSAPGHSILWFGDKTSKVIAYNCTFDGKPTIPLDKIEGDSMTPSEAAAFVTYATTDPLKDNPWFGNSAPPAEPSDDAAILMHVKELYKLLSK